MNNFERPHFVSPEEGISGLEEWVRANSEKARNLELPEEFIQELVPEKVLDLISDKDKVRIDVRNDGGELFIRVIERDVSPGVDPKEWEEWQRILEASRSAQEGEMVKKLPSTPDKLRLHDRFSKEVEQGTLSLKDRILMTCKLTILDSNSGILYVGSYDGEKGQGIATDFYLNALPEFAKKLGSRFIKGSNNASNIDFFVEKLGRVRVKDIKQEFRDNFSFGDPKWETVQFLYPEDREKYLSE